MRGTPEDTDEALLHLAGRSEAAFMLLFERHREVVFRVAYRLTNSAASAEDITPGLDCFSLRSTIEKALPDGTFQLASERRLFKVTKDLSATPGREPTL